MIVRFGYIYSEKRKINNINNQKTLQIMEKTELTKYRDVSGDVEFKM